MTMRPVLPGSKGKVIEPSLTAGNMEACHIILTGTHRGDKAGIRQHASASSSTVRTFRVRGRKVAKQWGTTDNPTLMQQIGVGPFWLCSKSSVSSTPVTAIYR
ncbi:hypothetical protein QFZ65_003299 [Arthrobacter sp. B3I9]|uniref:hypothetical protein n=1 Tax=Arthrobacter sp. B3I9 TaxID=3042270 RepID=UPI0027911D6A|nr:hypothetical protein [Arthrobacter sp. B3I9]MDQ0851361.1 hypothetical protein [Arthrobacter sp. B3I9]